MNDLDKGEFLISAQKGRVIIDLSCNVTGKRIGSIGTFEEDSLYKPEPLAQIIRICDNIRPGSSICKSGKHCEVIDTIKPRVKIVERNLSPDETCYGEWL